MTRPVALHVSPHPDDEAVGCMGTISTLVDAGWEVVNLLTTLGREGQEERRRQEAERAASAGGYRIEVAPEVVLESGYGSFERELARYLQRALGRLRPSLILSTSPHDGHPRHEAVGRSVAHVTRAFPGTIWWMYGIWQDLGIPTLYVEMTEAQLERTLMVLNYYTGELSRQDYGALVEGRARTARIVGSEKIFGYGSGPASDLPYAELLTETVFLDGNWWAGSRRVLDTSQIFTEHSDQRLSGWIERLSDSSSLAGRGEGTGSYSSCL